MSAPGTPAPDPARRRDGEPRDHQGSRAALVALRTVHVVAMALLVGGVAHGEAPHVAGAVTVASGAILLVLMVRWGRLELRAGAGWALFAKLALLGAAPLFPAARLELYLAATALTSVASHMPASWRHFTGSRTAAAPGTPRPR